jgi:TolA-binding protein
VKQAIIILSIVVAVLGIALAYEVVHSRTLSQSAKPGQAQSAASRRQETFRKEFDAKMSQDHKKHTLQELSEAENLYQVANKNWGTPEAKESLKKMVEKYPDLDRTGCALLYLAQMSEGDERAKYFQSCIDEYNDCFYGDGVQVGVLARFFLAEDYQKQGDTEKAQALFDEIKTKYPKAIDHGGNLLVNSINQGGSK